MIEYKKKRVTISVPENLWQRVTSLTTKGERSAFVSRAIEEAVQRKEKEELEALLKEQYLRQAERDRKIAEEFFEAENEAWGIE